jgi:anaerobic selenocysteine-containing dehydrogenase
MQNSQRDTERNLDTPTVEVPQSIAEQKGLAEGALARVFNDRASVVARIVIRPGGHAGTLRLEAGWYGQGMTTNDFTTASKADFGSQSAQYECRCNIESITG